MSKMTDIQLNYLFYGAVFAIIPVSIAFVVVLRQIMQGANQIQKGGDTTMAKKLTAVILIVLVAAVVAWFRAGANADITICHKTGHQQDGKWRQITVDWHGWKSGHEKFGDFVVSQNAPCPPNNDTPFLPDPTSTATPTATSTAVPTHTPVVVQPEAEPYIVYLPNVPNACSYGGAFVQLCGDSVIPFDMQP